MGLKPLLRTLVINITIGPRFLFGIVTTNFGSQAFIYSLVSKYLLWYTANIVNISGLNALSIDHSLVIAVLLRTKRGTPGSRIAYTYNYKSQI